MMRRATIAILLAVALLAVFAQGNSGVTAPGKRPNPALAYALRVEAGGKVQRLPNGAPVPMLSGAVVASAQEVLADRAAAASGSSLAGAPLFLQDTGGCPNVYKKKGYPNNIRANQDCGLRRQAEEQVVVNPADGTNIVVGQNDSRAGFNQTGIDWSIDGGRHWGDYIVPTRFSTCAGFSQDAFSDPAPTFNASGGLVYSAVGFDVTDGVSGMYAWTSTPAEAGSALHAPDSAFSATPSVIYDNCAELTKSPDKQFMATDTSTGSPFRGNVYITFTLFGFTDDTQSSYTESPIVFSRSDDGGATWSPIVEISGNDPVLCVGADAFDPTIDPNNCNFDQGSFPVIGPDGTIYVVYNNCNTLEGADFGGGFFCQQLLVTSSDGGDTWSAPVKVADDVGLQPFNTGDPDLGNGCPLGRQCLPPNGYRMNDFPAMGIDDETGNLAVFWADFRNGCNPQFQDCTEPNSNNDVFVSTSTDGGATWSAPKLVSQLPDGASDPAAQWQPWGDVGENGKLYVAYYDRRYGSCESSGCNDITLASSTDGDSWTYRRVTTKSMPNLTPDTTPIQAGFLGDYMSTLYFNGRVYIAWADTRGLRGEVEEDVYFAKVKG